MRSPRDWQVSLFLTREPRVIIDRHGKFVIPPHLSYASRFHEGRAAAIINGPCVTTNGGSSAREGRIARPQVTFEEQIDPLRAPLALLSETMRRMSTFWLL